MYYLRIFDFLLVFAENATTTLFDMLTGHLAAYSAIRAQRHISLGFRSPPTYEKKNLLQTHLYYIIVKEYNRGLNYKIKEFVNKQNRLQH